MEINSEIKVENAVSDMPVKAIAKLPCLPVKFTNPSINPKPKPREKARMVVPSIKKEPIQQTPAILAPIGGSTVNQLGSRATGIPALMGTAWTNSFLLMLYDILGQLGHPFAHFSKGLEVTKNIQEVIDLVWPGSDYKVQWSDTACSKVSRYTYYFWIMIEFLLAIHKGH